VVHNEWNAFAAVVEVGVVVVWWLGGVADAPAICVLCTKCGLKVKLRSTPAKRLRAKNRTKATTEGK